MDDLCFNRHFDQKEGLNQDLPLLEPPLFQGSAQPSLLPFKPDYRKPGIVRKLE
jgi:hypothetical protein